MQPYLEASIEDWRERYEARVAEFRKGEITVDVFRAKLYSLGFRGSEIDLEVRHNAE